ncbi:hypothetical protein Cob_v008051 [Colletotrichum orbiculare MAFF 240422]|uniref:Rhodopsin domain-containing protein n=1 Tax=Colletotrichum orbiculare (strain 104-T / ATCC 96160 / CBS 514.97 / LARS 414 / MAFF 240422) TaxID=1213857 RepID=N4VQV3_COLOR|nr:hypothetical protein Cob_v008051 [Colletotrichum orbiculare MAFF 240422]
MRIPPAEVLLSWPRPNYADPVKRGPSLLIIEIVFLGIALTCLGLRMYVRLVKIRRAWWDDWLMVAASMFCTAVIVCVILAGELYGWNVHVWDVRPSEISKSRQVSMAAQTLFLFASGLSKLSILSSYLRIAAPGTWFWRLTWVTGAVVFALIWIFLIVLWTQCAPIWHYWTPLADWGNCIAEWPPLAGQGITTVLTDVAVYCLPMPTLFRLRMPLTQRVSLAVLFGLGLVVVIASVARTYWVLYVEINYANDAGYDVTWDSYNIWIWTALEANLAVICGCAPAIRRLFTGGEGAGGSRFRVGSSVRTIGSLGKKRGRRNRAAGESGCQGDAEDLQLAALETQHSNQGSMAELVVVEEADTKA